MPSPFGDLIDQDLLVRHVYVEPTCVVLVKGIFEASEGLAAMFAERGGELTIAAPHSRGEELDALLNDLEVEFGVRRVVQP